MNVSNAVRLGDVADFIRGITFKPDELVPLGSDDSVACMRTKNVQDELDVADVWAVPRETVKREDQFLQPGDLLISSANSWNLIGKCSWVPELPYRSSFGGFVTVLRADDQRVDRRYLHHWFSSPRVQQTVRSFGQKTTNISNLNIERCRGLDLPLPSLANQRRIAAILDQAEALRTQRRTALARLEELANAVFREMFVRNADSAWPVETIANAVMSEAGAIRTGPFGSQLLHSEFVGAGIAVLGIDNVVTNEFRWAERRYITEAKYARLKRYTVKPGDVLITIMGTCGRCAVVPDAVPLAINTKHLCCITLDRTKVLPQYLHSYFLRHPTARRYLAQTAKGAIMSGLNMGIIQAMPLIIPPIEMQTEFVERLGSIESLKASHRASLAHLDALFASLQDRAFRGELFT